MIKSEAILLLAGVILLGFSAWTATAFVLIVFGLIGMLGGTILTVIDIIKD